MKVKVFPTELFGFDGRGPVLSWWLYEDDLDIPGTELPWEDSGPSGIVGAQHGSHWIIFHEPLVLLFCHDDARVYRHPEYEPEQEEGIRKTGIWEIEDSKWLPSFRRPPGCTHYIVQFYDEAVEVICRDLILGEGRFDARKLAEEDSRYTYSFWRYAEAQRELKHTTVALEYYQKFVDHYSGDRSDAIDEEDVRWEVDSALHAIEEIRSGMADG